MDSWNSKLLVAANNGDLKSVEDCLNHGAEANCTDSDGSTPLHQAAADNYVAIVNLLIKLGACADNQDNKGLTPLHRAAINSHTEIVDLLITHGASANRQDNYGWTPLHWAAEKGSITTADVLIAHGACVNSQTIRGWTPLHWAAARGATDTAALLITHGSKVNIQAKDGITPLHQAAMDNHMQTSGLLISRGAIVNSRNTLGRTPLHLAALYNHAETVGLLITRGANVSLNDNEGRTPYDFGKDKKCKDLIKVAQYQIEAGIPSELFQLDQQSASIFTDLLKEESYELFELRSMLQGEQGTGKSTIARFLVGKGPTKSRRSTDGIDLYTGLSFFDDDTKEWIHCKKGFKMEDITVSRSVKSFQSKQTPLKPPKQTNNAIAVHQGNKCMLPDDIPEEMFEGQALGPLSTKERHKVIFRKRRLRRQSSRHANKEISEIKEIKRMLPNEIHTEILENQEPLSEKILFKKLVQESSQVSADNMINISESDSIKYMLPRDEQKKIFEKKVDISRPKNPVEQHNTMNEQVPSGVNENAETIKSKNHPFLEIKNPGVIGKLKEFFMVNKEVNKVKISVTKNFFFKKSRDVAKKEFHKKKLIPVTIWDFGGQDVFYSTHQTFLTYRAVYMLILDGSRTLNEPCKYEQFLPGKDCTKTQKNYVEFWMKTITTYCKGDIPGFPKIMVILTHKDKLDLAQIEARRNEIFSEIERMFSGSAIEQHLAIKDRIFVNARNSNDPEMEQIKKSLICQARVQPTWGQKLPKCFLPLELELQYLVQKGVNLIHIDDMKEINSKQPIRPLTDSELKVFLKFQHSVGKILYFDDHHMDQHVIISPTFLIDAFKSIVTDKHFCKGDKHKEAWDSMDKKGIILKQAVETIWKQKTNSQFLKYMEYLLNVMTHLDILVDPLRYDSAHNRKPTEFYYVASMIRKKDTTGYLQSPKFCQQNIALCFDTQSAIIPPALSFRFISYCLSIWSVKTYGDNNEDMLFHRSAVFTIDPSLDVHIQCEDKQLIVRLVHARNRTLIMKDLASSIRECLFAALLKISKLYVKTSSEHTETMPSFDVKVCCSFSNEPCSIAMQDVGDVWICSHEIEHRKDLVFSWFTEKGKEICESFCPVTNDQFLLQTPTDLHLRRLSVEYDTDAVQCLVIQLGFPKDEWDKLRRTFSEETIGFTALHKCLKMISFTFKDIKTAVEKQCIKNVHTICKVLRDRHISFDREPEKWDMTPTDEDIDKLAPVIGGSSLAFLVELGLTFEHWEQIEYRQPERDLVRLNRKIMEAWIANCKVNNIRPTMRAIGQAFGNIGINIKNIENLLFI